MKWTMPNLSGGYENPPAFLQFQKEGKGKVVFLEGLCFVFGGVMEGQIDLRNL